MPSAATKPDTKPQIEGESAIKQALTVIDKKVRNLEKRKTKLDSYRAKKPDDLNDDQREAIRHYDEVIGNLEFARELQKQFIQINTDCDKVLKKQAKREKVEKLGAECRRVKEVLHLQNILDNMGTDDVREDFKTGKNGALMLTEENLSQLDEWYQLISPSREGESTFNEQCETAAEHLVSYLEGREKEVAGTTYAVLRSLVQQITDCGYFENMPNREEDTAQDESPADDVEPEQDYSAPAADTQESEAEEVEDQSLPTEPQSDILPEQTPATTNEQPTQEYYSQQPTAETEPRPRNIAEIVGSGSFSFLQDSEIKDSPHVDPAVVAAHPMAPGMVHSTDLHLTNTGLANEQSQVPPTQTYDPQQSQQLVTPQAMGDTYNATAYTQGYMAQPTTVQYETMAHQTAKSDVAADVPPPIPYPSETQMTSQSYVSVVEGQMTSEQTQSDLDKPFHTLNPNAPSFYSDQTSPRETSSEEKTEEAQFGDQQTDFQGSGGNNFQGRRGGHRGGRGSRGMNNGGNYRGNSRGGNYRGNYSGSSYQGFNSRNNYQSEGGYQGYNSNYRGGGFKRGGPRDGNTSRGAGSRGGAPRGGGRGGNRGNYSNRNGGFSNNQPVSA